MLNYERQPLNLSEYIHSEWNRRLGIFGLIAIFGVMTFAMQTYIVLPRLCYELSDVCILIPILIVSIFLIYLNFGNILYIIDKYPTNNSMYCCVMKRGGRFGGFVFGWVMLFQYILRTHLLTYILSVYTNFLFRGRVYEAFKVDNPLKNVLNYIEHPIDLYQILSLIMAGLMLCCSMRVVKTISFAGLLVCIFTLTTCGIVIFLHLEIPYKWANVDGFNLTHSKEILKFVSWIIFSFSFFNQIDSVPDEVDKPHKSIKIASNIFFYLFGTFLGLFSLAVLSVNIPPESLPSFNTILYTKTFNKETGSAGTYLMSVGGVCGLAAAGLASFVPTTRLVFSMANDNLICGKYLKHIYGKAGSPRVAVLFVLAIQLCLQLMVDEMYVKVVFQITIFCELIRMVIGNVVVYVDVFTGQAIEVGLGEARNVSYHSIQNESLISKTTYSTDGETSSEDELDEMLRRDICKHTTYGSLSTNHNCFLDPCVIEKCSKSCHLYEPSSPHINLQTFPISPKIVKRTVTNKEANIWLGIFVVATTVATSIFSQIEFDHFKSLTIYLSVILLTLLTAATFGILYVVLSIFFVDTKDELNGGGEEGLSSSQLVLRLVGIFLLIQCIFLFDIKVFGIVGVWGVVGIGYYFVNLSTYCT